MDKYTLMSRAGMWSKEVIESSHINESNEDAYSLHRMAGNIGQSTAEEFLANHSVDLELLTKAIQQGTINQYELRDVINGSAHPSKIKAFNDEFVTRGSVNESQWADQVKGNDEIVWVKTKEMGSRANYTPFYRGHDIDYGGHVFGSQSEMDKFVKDYILSNQWYNKLKHQPVKPIKINEVEQGETGLTVSGRNSIDNNKIGEAIESLGLYGEWNREGFWFLEEEQDMYDELEAILTKEFDKHNIQNYTIEGIW